MKRATEKHRTEYTAYWAIPDSDIPGISETMHTSRSYPMLVLESIKAAKLMPSQPKVS